MTSRKVAVVTGSNKGIGYAIVKGLCEKFDGDVFLTARDIGRGQAAIEELKKIGLNPLFHQLDITDPSSIDTFRHYLKEKYGGVDVLVNNAAIAFKHAATEPAIVQAKETIRVNYYGTLKVCERLFPLLRQNGRVVNLSSSLGHLSHIKSADLRAKLNDKDLTLDGLNELMDKYVEDTAVGKNEQEGWGNSSYAVSKVGVSALSNVQQRLFDAETPKRNISVNSVHPGYVDTDLTSHKGILTIEEGARAPLFLALQANVKGKYVWKDSSLINWDAPCLPEQY